MAQHRSLQGSRSQRETCCRKLVKECFWEYQITATEILAMIDSGSEQEKFFLFAKILENATDVLNGLSIFTSEDQKKMILRYKVSEFNHHFLDKRHKVLLYLLAGQQVDIPELRWNI